MRQSRFVLTARVREAVSSTSARSSSVRAGVVTGIPKCLVTSSGVRVRERCTRMPLCRRWCGRDVDDLGQRSPNAHSAPAARWPSRAPGPHASTAAIARACGDAGTCPTA